jgi:hypothetical protein
MIVRMAKAATMGLVFSIDRPPLLAGCWATPSVSKQTEASHEQYKEHDHDTNEKERQFKGHVQKINASPALAFPPVYPQRHSYILSRFEIAQSLRFGGSPMQLTRKAAHRRVAAIAR